MTPGVTRMIGIGISLALVSDQRAALLQTFGIGLVMSIVFIAG
jgi:hypothetical protein